jgi:NADH:ubiquinone oxidoreductase subunit 6 (subunit J)
MTDADDQLLRQRAASLRILSLALIIGVVTIVGVFLIVMYAALDGKPAIGAVPEGVPIITLIGLIIALPQIALSLLVPTRIRRAAAERAAAGLPLTGGPTDSLAARLAGAYVGSFILGTALAESAAILGAVFYLIEGHWLSLVSVGLGVLAMIWKFPSEAALRDWVEARLAEVPERPNYRVARANGPT